MYPEVGRAGRATGDPAAGTFNLLGEGFDIGRLEGE
jgi:hypothetical protein